MELPHSKPENLYTVRCAFLCYFVQVLAFPSHPLIRFARIPHNGITNFAWANVWFIGEEKRSVVLVDFFLTKYIAPRLCMRIPNICIGYKTCCACPLWPHPTTSLLNPRCKTQHLLPSLTVTCMRQNTSQCTIFDACQ